MMPSPSVDRETFLANLRQSGLISAADLTAVEDLLPETNRGRLIARTLVEQGLLTRFQAERLLAGRTSGFVLGQYHILDELGHGGMGRVFKAIHQSMKRVVALKVLSPTLVETHRAQQLFLREMQAAARLMHPNIVAAYDANQVGNRYFLVMEYVDGPNLDQLVREHGPLSVGLTCELMRQAAGALQYASDMGMVHRDIKPSNLLLLLPGGEARRKQITLKILDFGLARLQSGADNETSSVGTILSRPHVLMGTPDYISPEQARDVHAVDIRSDLYSLGATFYCLLAGRVPFPGGSNLDKIIRRSTQDPTPIEQLRPEVPERICAIVRRLMSREPADRFQSPAELELALEAFATPGPLPSSATRATTDLPAPAPTELADEADPGPSDAEFEVDMQKLTSTYDDLGDLSHTVPPDPTLTPLAEITVPALGRTPLSTPQERRRIRIAIAVAVALVGCLVGAVSLFCWLR
jgi:serine/threonine protein kinase